MIPRQIAVRARSIFHDDGLAQGLLEIVGNLPSERISRSARDEGYDEAHRTRRVVLRAGDIRQGRQRGSSRCHTQELTARKLHVSAPQVFAAGKSTAKL